MSDQIQSVAEQVRQAFLARPGHAFTHTELYQALGADGLLQMDVRARILQTLRYLVGCGYLAKHGERAGATFRTTGQPMTKQHVGKDAAAANRRERERRRYEELKAAGTLAAKKSNRTARVDSRAAMVPKPPMAALTARPVAETVEQFRARGGKVQRLTTHWEQMEQAA